MRNLAWKSGGEGPEYKLRAQKQAKPAFLFSFTFLPIDLANGPGTDTSCCLVIQDLPHCGIYKEREMRGRKLDATEKMIKYFNTDTHLQYQRQSMKKQLWM